VISMAEHQKASFNVARLKKGGENFEVVIDSDKAVQYKEGKGVELSEVLSYAKVFSDAQKGMEASEHLMNQTFKTSDTMKVADIILKEGEIQLTAEYREKIAKEKTKKVIDMINTNAIDPTTNLPHPVTRIENAMEEAKARVDPNKSVESQIQEIVKKLQTVMPIKFEIKEIAVKIPSEYAGKAYSVVSNFGRMIKEDWQNDGSWVCIVEVPAGLEQDFYDKINSLTHGDVESKVLSTR